MQPLFRLATTRPFHDTLITIARRQARPSAVQHACSTTALLWHISTSCRGFAEHRSPDPLIKSSPVIPAIPRPSDDEHHDPPPAWTNTLPSAEEHRRSLISKRFSHFMDSLQGNIFVASQRLNDLTGYSAIELLKSSIEKLEEEHAASQEAVRTARHTYKRTVAERASSQREVTTLLARKDTWTPIDLERFTSLYRSDHGNEVSVQEAATVLAEVERVAEKTSNKLSTLILTRYHEEQVLSDKIRAMSTWGTWGLMGLNILLFLVFQLGFEPWRRDRLVRGFEEKVRIALEKEKGEKVAGSETRRVASDESQAENVALDEVVAAGTEELESIPTDFKAGDPAVEAVVAVITKDVGETEGMAKSDTIRVPESVWEQLQTTWQDLFSTRRVSLQMMDVTIVALEGAASGVAVAGIVGLFLLRMRQ